MTAYYNEIDPKAADTLEELMANGLIAPGIVDRRSIVDVQVENLRGFTQHHFFAGIGVWSHALRRAGWPDERPVWTGSCPCQPFSLAGKGLGFADARHLWPYWFRLYRQFRPDQCFGEQVASADAWLDLVRADLEDLGVAFASVDLAAAGFAGAHIRQRHFWVADAHDPQRWSDNAPRHLGDWSPAGRVEGYGLAADGGSSGWLGLSDSDVSAAHGRDAGEVFGLPPGEWSDVGTALLGGAGRDGWVAESHGGVTGYRLLQRGGQHGQFAQNGATCDWLACRDAVWRPVEPGTFPLAYEAPARVGRLHGLGNAIDAETLTQFLSAYLEAEMLA